MNKELINQLNGDGVAFVQSEGIESEICEIKNACDRLVGLERNISKYYFGPVQGGTETGFHTFAMNAVEHFQRSQDIFVKHAGLPVSRVWCHSAKGAPQFSELSEVQNTFNKLLDRVHEISNEACHFLSRYLSDGGSLKRLTGLPDKNRASHLRVILSKGSRQESDLKPEPNGLICRHRPHVDNCVLTIVPPPIPNMAPGGSLFYSPLDIRGCWKKLQIPEGHVALFAGADLAQFTKDSTQPIRGLAHQVLATPSEALNDRYSIIYRLCVDPEAKTLTSVSGQSFSFKGHPITTGSQYYEKLSNFRSGY
jgi:hypothetical protein